MNIKKRIPSRLLAVIASMLFVVAGAWEAQCRSLVYRLHINDEIGSSTWQHTRRALEEATARNADNAISSSAIAFEFNLTNILISSYN